MQKYQLEAVADVLKALGAKEPFNEDYSAFTDEGLVAWDKLRDVMSDAAEAGMIDDDSYYDFKFELEDFLGMVDDEE